MVDPGQDSASERAYQLIRTSILEHTHEPGTMLGEASLAASLGVSRTPVRVALARLQDEGWIAIFPKRGAQVLGVTDRTAVELADARLVIETTAVSRADAEMRQQLAARLERSIEEQRQAFSDGDVALFIGLTLQFHRGFVEVGNNRVLLELYDRLADRHRFLLFGAKDQLLARCADIIAEHVQLVMRLRSGDVPGFAQALRGHIAENTMASVGLTDDALAPALWR